MPIKTRKLTKNDLQPYYPVTIKNADGTAVNLTGAAIVCTMRLVGGSTPKISRQNAGVAITDAVNGQFEYRWQPGDTDTAGAYNIEFEVTPQTGGKFTLPNPEEGTAQVEIVDSLDTL